MKTEVTIGRGYPCVVNDEILVKQATALAKAEKLKVEMLPLRTTAEDFGFYCKQYPSLFYRWRGRCGRTPAHGDILPRRSGYRRGHRLHAETGPATPGKITPGPAKRTQAGRDSGKTGTTEIRRRTEAPQIFEK